jgi:polyisoprenoid-binding protein YceI
MSIQLRALARIGFVIGLAAWPAACSPQVTAVPTASATRPPASATVAPASPTAPGTPTRPSATATVPAPTITAVPPTATASPTEFAGRSFELAPGESQASYTVDEEFFMGAVTRLGRELGWFTTVGVTDQMTGTLRLEPTEAGGVELVSGEFAVNVRALDSDSDLRDERIQREWLVSNVFPEAYFAATALENFPAPYTPGTPAMFNLVGDLTLHGVTRTVSFSTTATLTDNTLSGLATTPVLMTDFGFDPPEIPGFMRAENEVLITLNFVFREVEP